MMKSLVRPPHYRKMISCLALLMTGTALLTGCGGSLATSTNQTSSASSQSDTGNTQFALNMVALVSNVDAVAAQHDEKMTDAWGLEFGDPGRVWVNNSSGYSTVYDGSGKDVMIDDGGKQVPLAVKIPVPNGPDGNGAAPLTGMVFSAKHEFLGDAFVFSSEQGTIAGWNDSMKLNAAMRVDNSGKGAVYKGLTSADTPQGPRLYAADFALNTVDVFDSNYKPVTLPGKFVDPNMPSNYAPFGIKAMNSAIYVTYAEQSLDKHNDVGAVGHGYIDVFTTEGEFQKRLVSNGRLNSPWGMALAPLDFGAFSNKLLVGNFRDGYINVFDPKSGQWLGQVTDKHGAPLQIDQLWSLTFGNDNGAGKHNQLFFAAGPSSEQDGLFGRLDLVS